MHDWNGDAWTFLLALADGIAADMISPAPLILYLAGGLSAFLAQQGGNLSQYHQGSSAFVVNGTDAEMAATMNQTMMLGSTVFASPNALGSTVFASPNASSCLSQSPASFASVPRAKSRSLSINVVPKTKKGSQQSLSLSLVKEVVISPDSSASPSDNAAPPEPYSRITQNIIIGSDVLPMDAQGPKLLSQIGVTHILNMAAEIKNSPLIEVSNLFSLKWIPVHDNNEVELDDALKQAINFIGRLLFFIVYRKRCCLKS